jgi:hypothetical protein
MKLLAFVHEILILGLKGRNQKPLIQGKTLPGNGADRAVFQVREGRLCWSSGRLRSTKQEELLIRSIVWGTPARILFSTHTSASSRKRNDDLYILYR